MINSKKNSLLHYGFSEMYGRRIHTLTLVIHTVKMLSIGGHFFGCTKTHHRKMALRMLPRRTCGRRVRKQFATKGEALAFERTRWKKPKQSPG